jgi:hypothetical protein
VRDDDGLITPCQSGIPPVRGGQFQIGLFAADQSIGCGTEGTEVLLWTYVGDERVFATAPIPWHDGGHGPVDVIFSSREPIGAATEVQAFVGPTLCGRASTRDADDLDLTVA